MRRIQLCSILISLLLLVALPGRARIGYEEGEIIRMAEEPEDFYAIILEKLTEELLNNQPSLASVYAEFGQQAQQEPVRYRSPRFETIRLGGAIWPAENTTCCTEWNRKYPWSVDQFPFSSPSMENQPHAQWHYSNGNLIRSRSITRNDDGSFTIGTITNRFKHAGKLVWLDGSGIPNTNTIALVWGKRVNASNEQIWVHVYSEN